MTRQLSAFCLLVILLLLACDTGVQADASLGRIIVDRSIDGVQIGDDSAAVTLFAQIPGSL